MFLPIFFQQTEPGLLPEAAIPNGFMISASFEETRPVAQLMTALLVALALVGLLMAVRALARRQHLLAPRAAQSSIGWLPFALHAGLLIAMFAAGSLPDFNLTNPGDALMAFTPLCMGLHAALLFSPVDEAAFEIVLACPRPVHWLMLERFTGLFVTHSLIALAGTAVIILQTPETDAAALIARWLPPALLFSSLAVYITLQSKVSAFGLSMIGIFWFVFLQFGSLFIPGQLVPKPLHMIQPYIWPLSVFLDPAHASGADYTLNRLFIVAAGLALLTLTVRNLQNTENLLSQQHAKE